MPRVISKLFHTKKSEPAATPVEPAPDAPVTESEVERLARVLHDRSASGKDRRAAKDALVQLDTPEALGAIASLLAEPDHDWWSTAAWALRNMGEAGVQPALDWFESDEPWIRYPIAAVLGAVGGARAEEALIRHLRDDTEKDFVRAAAARSLLQMGSEQAADVLAPYLVAGPSEIQEDVLSELALNPAPWARVPLVRLLQSKPTDSSIAEPLGTALVALAQPSMVPDLVELLDRFRADVAEVAPHPRELVAPKVAVQVLCAVDDERVLPTLIDLATSGWWAEETGRAARNLIARHGLRVDPATAVAIDAAADDAPGEVLGALSGDGDPNAVISAGPTRGRTPVMWAVLHSSEAVARQLIALGGDVNHADERTSSTALTLAVDRGLSAMAQLLLDNGADVNDARPAMTPLMVAAQARRLEFMRLLLDAGADPTMRTTAGVDALTFVFRPQAAVAGIQFTPDESDVVAALTMLLEAGAPPDNADDEQGKTPLMVAAHFGFEQACQLLISAGADPKRKDADGDTAADWARLAGHAQLTATLS